MSSFRPTGTDWVNQGPQRRLVEGQAGTARGRCVGSGGPRRPRGAAASGYWCLGKLTCARPSEVSTGAPSICPFA